MAPVTILSSAKCAYSPAAGSSWSAHALAANRTVEAQLSGATDQTVGNATATMGFAQSFTPTATTILTEFRVPGIKVAAPTDNLVCTLRADSSGVPGTSLAAASNSIAATNMSTTQNTWFQFFWNTPVTLNPGTKYWFCITRSSGVADATNYYTLRYSTSGPYTSGGTSVLNNTTWGAETAANDLAFQVIQRDPFGIYAFAQDSKLHAYKSIDAGKTWTEQDSANAPTVFSSTSAFDTEATITGPVVMTFYMTAVNTGAARVFNMDTDSWASSTYGTTPPTTIAAGKNLRVTMNNAFGSSTLGNLYVVYTDSADDSDVAYQRAGPSGGAWGAKVLLSDLTSTTTATVGESVSDRGIQGYNHVFYYDNVNFDYSMRSILNSALGTETDLSIAAADVDTEHTPATYQKYRDSSNVDTIIAGFMDAAGTPQERILTLNATSASVTMATDNAVNAATTGAGRTLSTARYSTTNYFAHGVNATGINYYTSTTPGTWGITANILVSGATQVALAQLFAIDNVGLAFIYNDSVGVKFDWIVGPTLPANVDTPLLTGTGDTLVPAVGGDANVSSPLLTGTADVLLPALAGEVNLSAPLLTGTGTHLIPAVGGDANVNAVLLTGTGDILLPTLSGEVTILPPVLTGTGDYAQPVLSGEVLLLAPLLTGTGTTLVPGVGGDANVNAVLLTGTGDILIPSDISSGGIAANVDAVLLTGTGSMLVPALAGEVNLSAPLLTGTGTMLIPVVIGQIPATVLAPLLTGTGDILLPTLSADATLAAPLLNGSGGILIPIISGEALIAAPTLSGSGDLQVPSVSAEALIQAALMQGYGVLIPPHVAIALHYVPYGGRTITFAQYRVPGGSTSAPPNPYAHTRPASRRLIGSTFGVDPITGKTVILPVGPKRNEP